MSLVEAVRAAGVIGAGGAGFPTHVKLQAKADLVLINAAECEPLLRVDQQLLADQADALALAAAGVRETVGAGRAIFALKAKHAKAAEILRGAIAGDSRLSLHLLGDFYPAGDEHVLVREVTERTVPPGGIPPQVGVVVLNVETLLNVALAAMGQPVTVKYVTLAGAVAKPGTFPVPVGTSFADLIGLAGGAAVPGYGLIDGGPLMGALASPEGSVTKTTKGLLVLPAGHQCLRARQVSLKAQIRRAAACCCNCRMCTDLCPRYLLGHALEPHRSLNAVAYGHTDPPVLYTQAYLCSECGLCDTYACPMDLSPRRLHIEIKRQLAKAGTANPYRGRAAEARPEREWRRVPTGRLIGRLDLKRYDLPAPLTDPGFKPSRVCFPLKQGTGAAALPAVRPGDYVAKGQVVAEPPPGKLGCYHHASIDGRVERVDGVIEIRAV